MAITVRLPYYLIDGGYIYLGDGNVDFDSWLIKEVNEWLAENISNDWEYMDRDDTIIFNDESDAIAFKLRWF